MDCTVIIEWENAILSGDDRGCLMLDTVLGQITDLGLETEILILVDPEVVDVNGLQRSVEPILSKGREAGIAWRIETAEGLHYYELKNEGAKRASGDLLLFLDSDVIPDADWLKTLHTELATDFKRIAVGGVSCVDIDSLIGRAFAAGWFFPVRPRIRRIVDPAAFIFANNLLVRRTEFLANPFPSLPDGATRGSCQRWLADRHVDGSHVALAQAATVSHPPPATTIGHLAVRGLAEGRDHVADARRRNRPRWSRIGSSLRHVGRRLRQTNRVVMGQPHDIGTSAMELPVIMMIMTSYYGMFLVGAACSIVSPRSTARLWRI